ncbi:NAD synthetase [Helicobacter pylori]|uniref:NH(3)-dependent NAD(+) synthetase n=1 Tax=Helicobacter pylori TaxID=210 RepID=A0A1A9HET5_HELPX|nr:NAD+ synthase [Helicobacter pylori]ANH48984.1 NAD synthetase [Helicobacter pylori]
MQKHYHELISYLCDFLEKEVHKRGFKKVVYGLSGGLDSAVVGVLSQKVFKENAHALLMPSSVSMPESKSDALNLCETFSIPYTEYSIAPYDAIFGSHFKDASLTRKGNFCSRLRMAFLYDYSLKSHSLVIGTSNKSERMLGYGTLFGDLACAINPIGELFKTEVYELACHLNIPKNILDKPPSADLFIGQSDEKDLGYPYSVIDPLLKDIEALFQTKPIHLETLIQLGHDETLVKNIISRVQKNAFKLELPTIAKRFDPK